MVLTIDISREEWYYFYIGYNNNTLKNLTLGENYGNNGWGSK